MEIKQTLSITLSISLYQKLLREVGKGQISKFIRQIIEEKLKLKKEPLEIAYQECYANNSNLLKESEQWEQARDQDWVNWNKNVKKELTK
jgi:hypothetical protein